MFIDTLDGFMRGHGITLTEKQLQQFSDYRDLLLEWNDKINLTAITDDEGIAEKHFVDCVSAYSPRNFKPGVTVLDIGSGAGFPGIPIKIMEPGIKLTLMDSLQKRLGFLEALTEKLGFDDVELVHMRAEDAGQDPKYRETFDIVTARAVARFAILMEYTLPFTRIGGTVVALKGRQYHEEAMEGEEALAVLGGELREERVIEIDGGIHAVIEVEKVDHTPDKYPRKAGTPAKKPIGI